MCFDCGKKEHRKADCWGERLDRLPWEKGMGGSDGKGKEDKDKAKAKESAASAREMDAA